MGERSGLSPVIEVRRVEADMFVQGEQLPQVPDGRVIIASRPHILGVGIVADGGCIAVEDTTYEYL